MKASLAAGFLLWLAPPFTGQTASAPQPPVFAARVDSVLIDAFVTGAGGPARRLSARDFVLKDNGVPQPVDLVPLEGLPIRAIMVFDTSSSMKGAKLLSLRAAADSFLGKLQTDDEAALVSFSDEVAWLTPLTRDRAQVRLALFSLRDRGATAAYDALFTALTVPKSGLRTLIILFSDGEDTVSWLSDRDVRGAVERANALIHVVVAPSEEFVSGFRPKFQAPDTVQVKTLRNFAELTGGSLIRVNSPDRFEAAFTEIIEGMKNRYVLRYAPEGEPAPGWHTLELGLATKKGKVRGRKGYWVAPPTPEPPEK